jgi:hypothetical protein
VFRCYLVLIVLPLFAVSVRGGETYRVSNTEGFNRAVGAAKPGDRILLNPGEYSNNYYFRGVHGTADKPIIITAANPNRPPRLTGRNAPLHISGASYLEISDLVISGSDQNGLNIDDDGKPDKPAHHITLRNIRIQDVGPKGNVDGFKLSGLDDFQVVDCVVDRWGSGGSAIDMVGCHHGTIVGCTFRRGGENAVQTKGGSSEITIRKCHFEDTGDRAVNIGGLTANEAFRPPYKSFPANERYEAKDIRVEGCTFVRGEAAIAFVGSTGAVVRYNTIYMPEKYVIRILQERPTKDGFLPCQNGVFENNVVVFRSGKWADGGVNVGADTAPKTFRFNNNLWYCEDQPNRSQPKLPTEEIGAVIGKNPQLIDPQKGNFGIGLDSPARSKGAQALPEKEK